MFIFRILRTVTALFLIVFMVLGCSGLSTSSSSLGGEAGGGFDELDDAESGLYEDGPIDLPVTIAKLDSLNSELVTIEFSDSLTQLLTRGAPLNQTTVDSGYIITGEAGAVNLDQANKLFALNTSTGELTILEVETNGSFELEIEAEEGQVIALAPMVDAEDQIAAPIYADEENGVDTIGLTNSNYLNPNVNIEVNPDGYAYFSSEVADGTYEIYRRNLDGTALETVATGISSQVRFIVLDEQGSLNYVTQDGKVYSIFVAVTSTPVLAADGAIESQYVDYDDPFELMDFGDVLDDADTFVPAPAEVFRVSAGEYMGMTFVSNKRQVNSGAGGIVQSSFLRFIGSLTFTTYEFLSTSDYHTAESSLGELDTLFVAAELNDSAEAQGFQPFELYELDMTLGQTAWENRGAPVYSHATRGESLISMKATRNGLVVFVVQNAAMGTNSIYSLRDGESPVLVAASPSGDKTYSEWITLSEHNPIENTSLVTCATDASEGVSYLALHHLTNDDPGIFYRITSTVNKDGCKGNYAIDNENRVMFYRSETVDGIEQAPQISLIDIDNLNSDELVLDE